VRRRRERGLRVIGILKLPHGPRHGFDEATWLRRQGVHVVLRAKESRVVGHRGGIGSAADLLQRWLAHDTAFRLHGGAEVGDRGDRPRARERPRRHAPRTVPRLRLYHCLAVDGLKVATVAAGAIGLARLLGIRRIAAELAGLAAVGAYAFAVASIPPSVRAAVAAALGSLAWLAARERDRWHALLIGALVLLAWNPMFVLDAGFQLSFAAVAAIFIVTPRVVRRLEGYPVPRALAQLIGVSTACGIAGPRR